MALLWLNQGSTKALLILYGSINALLKRSDTPRPVCSASITPLLRLYSCCIKALLRLYGSIYSTKAILRLVDDTRPTPHPRS
eukprot:22123_4